MESTFKVFFKAGKLTFVKLVLIKLGINHC